MKILSYIFVVLPCLIVLAGCGKEPQPTQFQEYYSACPKEEAETFREPRPGLQVLKLIPVEQLAFRILPGSPPLDFKKLAPADRYMRFSVTFEVGEDGRPNSITLFNPGVPEVESIVKRTIGSWQYEAECMQSAQIKLYFQRAGNPRFSCELISHRETEKFLQCNGRIERQQLHHVEGYRNR